MWQAVFAAARMPMIVAIGSSLVAVTAFGGTLLAQPLSGHESTLSRVIAAIVAVLGVYVVVR